LQDTIPAAIARQGEGGIDSVEHRFHPLDQRFGTRQRKAHARCRQFRLGAYQPLGHRGGRGEESRRHPLGGETEYRLQHQRRARGRVDCRMGAGQHQPQSGIGKGVFFVHARLRLILHPDQLSLCGVCVSAAAGAVDAAAASDSQQPGLRVGGHPVDWPAIKGGE
jgi:hypothetical protein